MCNTPMYRQATCSLSLCITLAAQYPIFLLSFSPLHTLPTQHRRSRVLKFPTSTKRTLVIALEKWTLSMINGSRYGTRTHRGIYGVGIDNLRHQVLDAEM